MLALTGDTPEYWLGEFQVPVEPAGDAADDISSRTECAVDDGAPEAAIVADGGGASIP